MHATDDATVPLEREGLVGECVPAYRELRVEALPWDDIDALASAAEVVKASRSRKVVRITHVTGGESRDLYVKCYRFTDMARKLKYMLRASRARAEWETIRAVRALGVPTARGVLVAERRTGPLETESYLVTEAVTEASPADEVLASLARPERREALRCLGELVARLHAQGIYHDDLKTAHILLKNGVFPPDRDLSGLVLLDLHNAVVGRAVSLRQRATNLAQVIRSLPGLGVHDQLRLLAGMCAPNGPNETNSPAGARRTARRQLHRAALAALARRQG